MAGISQESFISTVFQYDNNGYTAKDEVYGLLCDELKITGISSDDWLVDFKEKYGYDPVSFNGVHEALASLNKMYKLGLITNGRMIAQNTKINKSEIRHYFDLIKISGEEGVKKPNGWIFESCIQNLTIEPHEYLFVGDHPVNDVDAAKSVEVSGV